MFRFLFIPFLSLSVINFSQQVLAQSAPSIEEILPANAMACGTVHSMKDFKEYSEIEEVFREIVFVIILFVIAM